MATHNPCPTWYRSQRSVRAGTGRKATVSDALTYITSSVSSINSGFPTHTPSRCRKAVELLSFFHFIHSGLIYNWLLYSINLCTNTHLRFLSFLSTIDSAFLTEKDVVKVVRPSTWVRQFPEFLPNRTLVDQGGKFVARILEPSGRLYCELFGYLSIVTSNMRYLFTQKLIYHYFY